MNPSAKNLKADYAHLPSTLPIGIRILHITKSFTFRPLLTLFLTIRHIDCTVFPMKNLGGVHLPTTRVCPARMAATASSASAASISVTHGPTATAINIPTSMNVLFRINQPLLGVLRSLFRSHPSLEVALLMRQSSFGWTRVADQGAISV